MNELTKEDYSFLKRKTKLTQTRLNTLIDNPGDFNLVIDCLSTNCQLKELHKLSFSLKSRIIIFNKVQDLDISLDEKAYVADSVQKYHPEIVLKNKLRMVPRERNTEEQCRYFLTLFGLNFKRSTKIFKKNYLTLIENSFAANKREEISKHFQIWVKILNKIEEDDLLVNSCPNSSVWEKIPVSERLNTLATV
jgi:hypothetical protein